jgi:hypothetical protein
VYNCIDNEIKYSDPDISNHWIAWKVMYSERTVSAAVAQLAAEGRIRIVEAGAGKKARRIEICPSCEACSDPATHRDDVGIPLCKGHYDQMVMDQ